MDDHGRFIPAGAGNRIASSTSQQESPVHPRGRGEQPTTEIMLTTYAGSSPRARGTAHSAGSDGTPVRFIPAGAGNSQISTASRTASTVHPRGRGEQLAIGQLRVNTDGSSPRARGTDYRSASERNQVRFIPAGAGNSTRQQTARPPPPVHPRGRGEQFSVIVPTAQLSGSSPRARGTVMLPTNQRSYYRFIPAGAGNSDDHSLSPGSSPVHPRGRGEQQMSYVRWYGRDGSSPRARGTGSLPAVIAFTRRFIPAGAGNSSQLNSPSTCLSVHPRGRGEQASRNQH